MIRYHTMWDNLCQIVMCLCIIIVACGETSQKTDNLSPYYFPINSLPAGGQVYTYRNLKDTLADKEVWRHIKHGEGRLESVNYDFRGEVVQRQYDRIVSNGVITDSLILFFEDSLGTKQQRKVNVISPHRFPFEPGDSTKSWLTHLEWWQPEDSLHIVLERRRRFSGFTQWEHSGKSISAVRFKTEDKFETEKDGWTTSAWTGEEIYALNIGLVYYRRKISEVLSLEFELESLN